MFNIQLHNWLLSDESIPLLHPAPSSLGWLAIDESAPFLLRCWIDCLHLSSLSSQPHSSFDALDGVCRVGSPY